MAEFFGKITDALKSSLSFTIAIFITASLVIFLPKSTFEYLELNKFTVTVRPWASLILFLTGSSIIVQVFIKGYTLVNKHTKENQERRKRFRRLSNLTPEEKRHLMFYLTGNNRTATFGLYNGVILQLEKDGVVSRMVTEVSHNYGVTAGIPFNINDWAWEIINEHPEYVLQGFTLEQFLKNR